LTTFLKSIQKRASEVRVRSNTQLGGVVKGRAIYEGANKEPNQKISTTQVKIPKHNSIIQKPASPLLKSTEDQLIKQFIFKITDDLSNVKSLVQRFDLAYTLKMTEQFFIISEKVRDRSISLDIMESYADVLHRIVTFLDKRINVLSGEDHDKREFYLANLSKWEVFSSQAESVLKQFIFRNTVELLEAPYVSDILHIVVRANENGLNVFQKDLCDPAKGLGLKKPNASRIINSLVSMGLINKQALQDDNRQKLLKPGNWLDKSLLAEKIDLSKEFVRKMVEGKALELEKTRESLL
jgi:hypothetical protein